MSSDHGKVKRHQCLVQDSQLFLTAAAVRNSSKSQGPLRLANLILKRDGNPGALFRRNLAVACHACHILWSCYI